MNRLSPDSLNKLREALRRYRSIKAICNEYGISRTTANRIRREAVMANDEAHPTRRAKS